MSRWQQARAITFAAFAVLPADTLAAANTHGKCDDPAILRQIVERYPGSRQAEAGLGMEDIIKPRLRYQVQCEPLALMHDQCSGDATMSDGSLRKLFFTVKRQFGLVSRPDIIHFCILGAFSSAGNKACGPFQ